jgi:hypothetical protein
MLGMDGWDVLIIAAAGYIAVMTLVRMMNRRRDSLIDDLSRQATAEQERKKKAQRKQDRQDRRRQFREANEEDAA